MILSKSAKLNKLIDISDDENKSFQQNLEDNNFHKVYDAGTIIFEKKFL